MIADIKFELSGGKSEEIVFAVEKLTDEQIVSKAWRLLKAKVKDISNAQLIDITLIITKKN
jgi:hypothetical protein